MNLKNFILIIIAGIVTSVYSDYNTSKIHPYLLNIMQSSNDNSLIPVYIIFNESLTLNDFSNISYDTPKKDRRRIVLERLQNFADIKQSRVRSFIETRSASTVIIKEQLWIVNAIVLQAAPSVINQLAAGFNEIKQINYDPAYPVELMLDFIPQPAPFNILAAEPGCVLMNADDVWALGNKGAGVIVANADDGFWWRHPDLVHGIWQNLGEDANNNGMTIIFSSGTGSTFDAGDINNIDDDNNGKVDDLIGWDFTTNNYNITTAAHGSATMGHVVGDGTGGTQTGVAPLSKGICMRNSTGYTQQIAAFQYALQMGADIVTSSLSWKWYFNPKPDYSLIRQATDISLAAGMIHSNSTSNDGNSVGIPLNISSAGCNPAPWRHPDQLKIGNLSGVIGVGNVNCSNDIIYSSSPYGPTTWGNWSLWGAYSYTILPQHMDYPYSRVAPVEIPDSMGLLKPDVSAPGQNSISTYVSSGSGYGTFGGTSSATPHTAGCLALMLSINPEMLPGDLDRVIELTAVEKGNPGKDYRYGAGRIDALAATTSPPVLCEGVNGGSNWLLGSTTPPNDTARELVGLKFLNTNSPWIGSIRKLIYNTEGTATTTDVEKYRLFWDVNKNSVVDGGDILLKEMPFVSAADFTQVIFDTVKFKVTDTVRHVLLTIKTKSTANSSHTINVGMNDNLHVTSYYNMNAQTTNFPFGVLLAVKNNELPLSFTLLQNYPNPFNPATIIKYSLAKKSLVVVKIYDVIGREMAVLLNNIRDAGNYQVEFDADFYTGKTFSSGVYFYKLEAFDAGNNSLLFSDIKKMVVVK